MNRLKLSLMLTSLIIMSAPDVYAQDVPYKRIISLAPNITEMLYALGLESSIAGVTDYCDYPPEAKLKPKIGGMSNPSLEAVIRLSPDIVVMTTDGNPEEFQRRLSAFGIKTIVLRQRRLWELPDTINELGIALGSIDSAISLSSNLKERLSRFQKTTILGSALFVVWPEPLIAAGKGTLIDDALGLLGFDNLARSADSSYPRFSMEESIRLSPDYILIGRGHDDIKNMSTRFLDKLKDTPAVRFNRVFFLSDSLFRYSPRAVAGMEEIQGLISAEAMPDVK